jgi:predicted ArsR family transcriptional regulator
MKQEARMTTWRELTFPRKATRIDEITIEDERASVLTDELRWRILESLGDGKSLEELSSVLEVTDAWLLHHLEQLAQTGVVLLERTGSAPTTWCCQPAAERLRVRETAVKETFQAVPDSVASQFNQASRESAEGLFGSSFQVSINHNRSRMSEEQAAEFSQRLVSLIEEYFLPGKGDPSGIKYGFYGVLTPIDLHPLEDSD